MATILPITLNFLTELKTNNNRDWFNKQKHNYLVAHENLIEFAQELLLEMKKHDNCIGVFLETAHPIKFLDTVEPTLNIQLPIPSQIESVLNKEKVSIKISTYEDLKSYLK